MELDAALRHYCEHECIVFWNPRDITPENVATDMPDAEALMIEPGCITSCEAQDGQYLVKAGRLQQYEPYPGHEGIDEVFIVLMRRPPCSMERAAIEQCVSMGWQIMEATSGDDGTYRNQVTVVAVSGNALSLSAIGRAADAIVMIVQLAC